ncbi:MAG: hypothetical protein IIC32_01865 [Chloroflexi bacterium]|nr:hypothetical protein [Chloroflexota bacterium]
MAPITVMAIAAIVATMLVRAQSPPNGNWPSFVMVYETDGDPYSVGQDVFRPREVHRLEWHGVDRWRDEVVESDDVITPVGTFSRVGSYKEQRGSRYVKFDAIVGKTTETTLDEGYVQPHGMIYPRYKEMYLQQGTAPAPRQVTRNVSFCRGADCASSVAAVAYDLPGGELVFTAGPEAIPLAAPGGFRVRELTILRGGS